MLSAICNYYRSVLLHVPFKATLDTEPVWDTEYDVEAWRQTGIQKPLREFRYAQRERFPTRVDPAVKSVLLSRIDTFGEHAAGLGRFTRTMFANDFRRKIERPQAHA